MPVLVIHAETQLFHRICDFLRFVCTYEPYDDAPDNLRDTPSTAVTQKEILPTACVNNWYMGVSHHYIIDDNVDRYTADTTRTQYVNDC